MKHLFAGVIGMAAFTLAAPSANALVLCVNSSGSVTAVPACKSGFTALDVAEAGLVGPAGATGATGPIGASTVFLAEMGFFEDVYDRISTFNGLDLPAGTYLVGGKGSMTSEAYGSCQIISGPEAGFALWDSFSYANNTKELAVVLFAKVTLTGTSTNVAMRCGNGFAADWSISQPVLWAMPVAP